MYSTRFGNKEYMQNFGRKTWTEDTILLNKGTEDIFPSVSLFNIKAN
jgi:hypothetical protein